MSWITETELGPVQRAPSPNHGGRMLPTAIVLHETASRLEPGSAVAWLCDPKARASAHFVIERDGRIVQLVPIDQVAWHAGHSEWRGRKHLNGWSIGIELVGPGRLTQTATGFDAWWGPLGPLPFNQQEPLEVETPEHGHGWWLPFTPAQRAALEAIIDRIVTRAPIREIVTHWQISPRRKIDPNPLFPLDDFLEAMREFYGIGADDRPSVLRLGSSGPRVAAAQRRLVALGYGAGDVDGHYGPRTRAAVLAFQAEAGLPVYDEIDGDTFEALMAEDAPEFPRGVRDEATVSDLRRNGSQTVAAADNVQAVAAGGAVISAGEAARQTGTLDAIQGWVTTVSADRGWISEAIATLSWAASKWWVALPVAAVIGWRLADRIKARRLEDHRTGRHTGGAQ